MYFSIRIGLASDGTTKLQSITACETLDDAKKKYHSDLNGYIGNCTRIACFIAGLDGNIYARETWEKTQAAADEEA